MFSTAEEVRVGVKSQIVIPAKIRKSLKIVPGDTLLIVADRNERISIMKKPENWVKAVRGSCKGVWGDNPQDYLKKERESWT